MYSGHNKTNEVAITTLAFPANETTTFWVGTEEGSVYQANRYDRAGAKAGLQQTDIYRGHSGPIMGIDFHPLVGPVDFSDYFLTSSVDWTVKLWRRSTAKPSNTLQFIAPLYSFDEADDYVYDVKWHPSHPALFGTVDGAGRFDLWNLNIDTEVCERKGKAPSFLPVLFRTMAYPRKRFPSCRRRWAQIGLSINWNGIRKMVAEQH